ncbi:MAG: 23S rRNA (pseudouridine(1915)-N(3))-methyltransferase RlmH [Thermodesulfobacteriota bacterium]
MHITILAPGKTKEMYIQQGVDDFLTRLNRYTKATLIEVKVKGRAAKSGDKDLEADSLLGRVPAGSYLVSLDPRGSSLSSEQLASNIRKLENQGTGVMTFVIGGPQGISEKVLNQSSLVLSLSKMTFTHDMARLLLVEQLYRAYSINAGSGYHK